MKSPLVSIIVCTRNNAQSLQRTLSAIAGVVRENFAELIVVDNHSSDDTASAIKESIQRMSGPHFRVIGITENRKGQCYARNAGLSVAEGEIVLFTDDDVVPCQEWVEGMTRPIVNGIADAVAGGVHFPAELDRLVPSYARQWLAATDAIDPLKPDRLVGANMAFHRRVLERVPRFDVELGPGALGFHDETLFAHQLLEAGYCITAAKNVSVEHHFDSARLTRRGLLDIADRIGRSDAYLNHHWLHLEQSWPAKFRAQLAASKFANSIGYQRRGLEDPAAMRWQIDRAKQSAYLQQYAIERRRPRNYQPRGLLKVRGIEAVVGEMLTV